MGEVIATIENMATAATPHNLLHEGLISRADISAEAMTDGILLINAEADRVGSTEDGAAVLLTEHGHVPLQPGTVLNVVGMDDEGVFARPHYIGEGRELRDILRHEDGSPYFPPVVTQRMGSIAAVNAAIREEFDAPGPVPMHDLYEHEGWTLEHNPDEPIHPSLVNHTPSVVELIEPLEPTPAIGRARPVVPLDMEFTEAHQAELNTILNMEDVLSATSSVVESAAAAIAEETAQLHILRSPEVRGHRNNSEGLPTHLAAGVVAVARTLFRQGQGGRHRRSRVSATS